MDAAVAHVESICATLQVSPKVAGAQLMELRSSPDAISIAKCVLEKSNMTEAQFHATSMLQHALLERHTEMPPAERAEWRAYLATFVVNRWGSTLQSYVASQLLQTFAVLWKRSWTEETQEAKAQLFHQLYELSRQPDKTTLAAKYMVALVSEFSSTSKSAVAIGLPLEFHRQAHKGFTEFGLHQVLEMGMAIMGGVADAVMKGTPEQLEENVALTRQLESVSLLLMELLSWDFGGLDPLHEPTTTQFITPPISWRPLLIQPDFISAMLEVYRRVRACPASAMSMLKTTSHVLRQVLLQLAAVQGPIFATSEDRAKYAAMLFQGGMQLVNESLAQALQALQTRDEDALEDGGNETGSICNLLQTCVSNFRLPVLASFPFFPDLLRQLGSVATQLLEATVALATGFNGEAEDFDMVMNGWTMEAFDMLLEAWVTIVQDPMLSAPSGLGIDNTGASDTAAAPHFEMQRIHKVVVEGSAPLYQSHLMCRITLGRIEAASYVNQEEGEEGEVADVETSEQHKGMACLGRLCPTSSLLAIKRLMVDSNGCLPRLNALMTGAAASEADVAAMMEEVRVLVLACGHLLADDYEGESPAIPEPLHHLCFQQPGTVATSPTFSSLLIDTINTIMMLSKMLIQRIMERPDDPLLSPVLNETVLWFLTRWAKTYLLPDHNLYKNHVVAPALLAAYGPGEGAGGAAVANELLQTAWVYLTRWPSEADVACCACRLLRALLTSPIVRTTLYLPSWRSILNALAMEPTHVTDPSARPPPELGYMRLHSEVRAELLEVLGCGILAKEDHTGMASEAFMKVAGPLEARLQQVVLPSLGRGTDPYANRELESVARLYAGLARAVDNTGQGLLSTFMSRALEPLVHAASVCRSYPEAVNAILVFLRDYAEVHCSSLTGPETMALLHACGHVLKIYAQYHRGRSRGDAIAVEEAYADVLCVLKLLYHLVMKDFVDFSGTKESELAANTISEVVFYGLREMIPLMSDALLQFPLLAKQYFLLINSMVSTYTDRVAALDHALFCQLLDSVMFGIQRSDSEIARDSLKAVADLAAYHAQALDDGRSPGLRMHLQAKPTLLADLLRKLLEMVVFEASIWDRLDACAGAILALVMCDRGGFAAMVNGILEQLKPEVRERLRREFEELATVVPPVGGRMDRHSRAAFRERLKEFAKRVRPFMQMR